MENRAIILHCLNEIWPDEVSMLDGDLVARIVDDALSGQSTPFRAPRGGDNFDLTPFIDIILNATILLVTIAQLRNSYRHMRPHNTPNPPDEGDLPDHTEENMEDLVKRLVQLLTEARDVERREATKLVRVYLRVSSGGGHA